MHAVEALDERARRFPKWAVPVAAVIATISGSLATSAVAHADTVVYPGMEIVQPNPTEKLTCTLGFVDPQERIGVTAGHCGGDGPVFNDDGVRIGQLAIARTNIQSEQQLAPDDYRIDYEGISFDDGVTVKNVLPNGLELTVNHHLVPRMGLPVCRVGITTGEACGTVSELANGWFLVDGLPVDHGDSGCPVYTITSPGHAAIIGIVSARYKSNATGDESTVALSWPVVVKQMREDLAARRNNPAE